ncbi:sugar phosphate isomerase/epimerase [Myxococcota bacterium]|nr:sugar phosphate isomerase/epimerase [Myxococcota bacterium]
MHPRISINTISTLAWPLAADLALLERLGAPCFGFPLLKIEADVEGGLASIRRSGRKVSCVAASTADVSLLDPEGALAVLRPAIDAAHALSSPVCYFTSGRTPERMTTDAACAALVAALPPSIAYAKSRGVRLAIENNSVTNRRGGFVHTLRDTIRLTEEVDLGICLELQNCWYERDLARLFREHVGRLAVVQVSDFRVGEPLWLNRRVPGDGSIPLAWMIETLLDACYAGVFDIEVIGPAIDAEGPEAALRRSVSWLGERLTEYGA